MFKLIKFLYQIIRKNKMRKILYSPGYGAGWSSWNTSSKEVMKFMVEYQPIIDAIEAGEKITQSHPAVIKLQEEVKEKFNQDYLCVLGAEDLEIYEAQGLVRIEEYDGYESVVECYDDWI